MPRLQLKRGLKANLPSASMLAGEAHFTTDRGTLHVATGATLKLPVVPAIDDLATIAAVDGAADFLILQQGVKRIADVVSPTHAPTINKEGDNLAAAETKSRDRPGARWRCSRPCAAHRR